MLSSVLGLLLLVCSSNAYINPRPQFLEHTRFTRWLVHESNWTVLATTSQMYGGVAFPNLMAVSDGTSWENCTGHIYFYFTQLSTVEADLLANSTVTMGFYEVGEKDHFCVPGPKYDPEDPNCAKAHIVGNVRTISNVTAGPEAQKYLFWRHPAMATWPKGHNWITVTLDIKKIDLLDFYGGLVNIDVADYYKSDCK